MAMSRDNGCREAWWLAIDHLGLPPTRIKTCDLGNQRAKFVPGEMPGARRITSLASLWRWFGAEAACIDINGRDGALPLDLRQPIPAELVGRYDLVTDFGTLEHVADNQWQAWKNAHDLTRVGGIMVHCLPAIDTCPPHGRWAYSVSWMSELIGRCGYGVLMLDRWFKKRNDVGEEWYVRAVLSKSPHSRFPDKWRDPIRWSA